MAPWPIGVPLLISVTTGVTFGSDALLGLPYIVAATKIVLRTAADNPKIPAPIQSTSSFLVVYLLLANLVGI